MSWRDVPGGGRWRKEDHVLTPMSDDEPGGSGEPVPFEEDRFDMNRLAEQLVASAAQRGVELTGNDGLLTALTRQVLQAALEVEMSEHLGYDKHAPAGRNGGNSRNGSTPKTVRTEIGRVTLDVPRDRDGSFTPRSCVSTNGGWRGSTSPSSRCTRRG